jgi:hypothetical protein
MPELGTILYVQYASFICQMQCCGSGMFVPDLGSKFIHPGSRIQGKKKHRIPDPQQRMLVISRKYDPGCLFRILIPDVDFFYPGSGDQKSTGSRIRIT